MVVLTKKKNVSKSRTKIRTKSKSKSNFKLKNSSRTSKVMRGGATSVPKNSTLKRKQKLRALEEKHPSVSGPSNQTLWRNKSAMHKVSSQRALPFIDPETNSKRKRPKITVPSIPIPLNSVKQQILMLDPNPIPKLTIAEKQNNDGFGFDGGPKVSYTSIVKEIARNKTSKAREFVQVPSPNKLLFKFV